MIPQASVRVKFLDKFKKVNLSKTIKDATIKRLAEKLDSEEEIDAELEIAEPFIIAIGQEADRVRAEEKNKTKTPEDSEVIEEPDFASNPGLKPLYDLIKKQGEQIETLKTSQVTGSLTEKFSKDPRVAKIPQWMQTGFIPKSEEEFEAKVEELTTNYNSFAQQNKLASAGEDTPEGANTGGVGAVGEKVVNSAIDSWAAGKVPVTTPVTK